MFMSSIQIDTRPCKGDPYVYGRYDGHFATTVPFFQMTETEAPVFQTTVPPDEGKSSCLRQLCFYNDYQMLPLQRSQYISFFRTSLYNN